MKNELITHEAHEYEVIVQNIGRVYAGVDETEARRTYYEYMRQSKSGGFSTGGGG